MFHEILQSAISAPNIYTPWFPRVVTENFNEREEPYTIVEEIKIKYVECFMELYNKTEAHQTYTPWFTRISKENEMKSIIENI